MRLHPEDCKESFKNCKAMLHRPVAAKMDPLLQLFNSSFSNKEASGWPSADYWDTNSSSTITASDLSLPEPVNAWDIVLCVTGTVMACENAIVLAILFYTPSLRAPMFLLIGSLALADLLAGLGLVSNFIVLYVFNTELAILSSAGLLLTSFSASVCSLLAITADRYLSLYNALTYHTERTLTFTYLMLIIVWVLCLCIGLLPVMGWNCVWDQSTCSILKPVTQNYATVLAVSFLLIFAIMMQLYLQICKIAFRHAQQIAVQHQFMATSQASSTRKGVSTLSLILGTFAVCWLPFAVYSLVADSSYPMVYTYSLVLPVTCNSVINPIIYAFRNPDIQKSLWVACCGCISPSFSSGPRTSSDV